MKTIPSQEVLLSLFEYNQKTGILRWRIPPSRSSALSGGVAGYVNISGYRHLRIHGVVYLAHRVIWTLCTGEQPPEQIDHLDGDRSNNSWANLRASSHAANQQNRCISSRNKSGYTGVRPSLGKWRAEIRSDGVFRYLGTYDTPELADEAYRAAKKSMHSFQPVTRTTNLRPHNIKETP